MAVGSLARVYKFFQLSLDEQQTLIRNLLIDRKEISILSVFDAQGKRIPKLQAISDVTPEEVAHHQALAEALLKDLPELGYSVPYTSPSHGYTVVTLAFPVGDPDRKIVQGFVAAEVSLQGLHKLLDAQPLGSTGFAQSA